MATTRVLNISTGLHHKLSQAENWIADGSHAWVERFKKIRALSLQERVTKRSELAKLHSPMPFAEIPGLRYEPSNLAQTRQSWPLIAEANRLAAQNG